MKKLMIFVDWFAPGYKGGGQIQSCVNLAIALQHRMEVLVVTTDRDLGSNTAYDSVVPDEWNLFDKNVRVLYLSPKRLGFKSIREIIRSNQPDVVYLNSMFSVSLTLLPLEVCRFEQWKMKVVLAPRGMLHEGALQYKKLKKQLFFRAFKIRRFHKRILFHATDRTEEADIRKVFGQHVNSTFVDDFPSSNIEPLTVTNKIPGELNCLFVSRISPKKNLLFLLKLLPKVSCKLKLTIIGPAEDEEYWQSCQQVISQLPENIRVEFLGPKANHELSAYYKDSHLFVLPTFGENFGHVIYESLLNGRPVLISDQSPWTKLQQQNVGWDIPLADETGFISALNMACQWDNAVFNAYCESSWKLASRLADTTELANKYLSLFQ